mgnify:FL=1
MSQVKMLAPVPATTELLKEQLLARNHDLFPPVVLQSYIVRLEGYAEIDREDTILDVEDVIHDIKQSPYAFAPYINMYLFEGATYATMDDLLDYVMGYGCHLYTDIENKIIYFTVD